MRMRYLTRAAWAALLALAFTLSASAADLEHGKRVFRSCASCHAIETDRNAFGPHLKGVVGRKAGSVPGYNYSPAMRAAGESGLVWDEQALAEFLADPQEKVPGNKMRFWGLWKSESGDLIAYLKAHP
jgi:cytochrome c